MTSPKRPEAEAVTEPASMQRGYTILAGLLLLYAAGVWVARLRRYQHNVMSFDDAYMFARYAGNLRHGLGFSWNPDGVPTYGPTSLLWTAVVFLFSFLPLGTWSMLILASWLCSLGAVGMLTAVIRQNARTPFFRSTWRILPLVVLPVCWAPPFATNQVTGMETMLAMLLLTGFLGCSMRWVRGAAHPWKPAVWAILCILTRPESAVVVLLFPACLYFLWREERTVRLRGLLVLLGMICVQVAVEAAACRLYFGTAFPLSLYMKGHAAYQGYAESWYPDLLLLAFLAAFHIYLLVLILLVRRRDLRWVMAFVIPFAVICGYLLTVTQIMGFYSRYYAPYLPLMVLPAFLMADRWAAEMRPGQDWVRLLPKGRIAAAALVLAGFVVESSQRVQLGIRKAENRQHLEYDAAQFGTVAVDRLAIPDWAVPAKLITDELISKLPAGAVVAATEVGYLGAMAPQCTVIDLAGLNDTQIALHGFSMDALMALKPDVIWMPHDDYTWQRGVMAADPRLMQLYDVYPTAANYGIALRKDSRFRPQIDLAMAHYWNAAYPGRRMADYRASSASWSGRAHLVSSAIRQP